MFKVHSFVAPHVALEQFIAKQTSDFVLVDTEAADGSDGRWAANAIDHVRNTPDLDNRPLRLSSRALNRPMIAELCRRGTIRLVTHADMHRVGFAINVPERSPRFDALIEPLRDAPCLLR
jgi:hypothetical protein